MTVVTDDDGVQGVRVRHGGRTGSVATRNVVLAAGGFQANAEMRTRYMGPGWELAKVRGTRFNTGDGIRMALEIGASPCGNWSGCHAVQWEMNAPEFGDLAVGDQFQKHSYPFAIMVNATGKRFVDEGADFRNYTYAKYGRVILEQPGQFAWQIFDQKVKHLQRDEYRIRQVTKAEANTLEELAAKLEISPAGLVKTVREFNAACQPGEFNPAILDGKSTKGITPPKSHWARRIETAPYYAYPVRPGITFTYLATRVNKEARMLMRDGKPSANMFAAGEIMAGNVLGRGYAAGMGMTIGSVFGRIAGREAAANARN